MTAIAAHPGSDYSRARPRSRGRFGRLLKETVLALVGILGLLAIIWLACAMVFGLSIVVFKTGSMAPSIPTGSAAIVQDVTAADIAVGDVITVQRDGSTLPVTHRVVAIELDPSNPDGRLVTLRGDANASNDFAPYAITEAKRVVASVAGFGVVIAVMRSPFFLAVTSLIVALLCVWAFWPAQHGRRHRLERGARS